MGAVDLAGWLTGWFAAPAAAAAVPADEDASWLERVGRGDDSALQRLFERWKLPLLGFFYRSLGSRPDAEDLTLEVFVRLHRAAPRYRRAAKFSTYLFHVARNLLLNELRRRQRKPAPPVSAEAFDYLAADPAADTRRAAELEEVFQHALDRLPEKYRTPLLLVAQQHLDHAEAAAVLGVSENALRVLVFRGRQLLRREMETLQ